ncbi:MAG: hypothetical protein HOH09_01735 [Proteobacteria bacterium]|jgi:hypothetical protein|nr:hypothetical protein [Pseudomonadota bacterium]MBT5188301.1 hypothetical protein [Pseudomonadota bacterium]MBT6069758.1 hypothetical protein [Pseudomonadota bacterium]MBT6932945.1 hypothetical protein [Pseudomonadota bacterium]MBT7812381.1 hypothetical protein [Pseudomonadota bacterium]
MWVKSLIPAFDESSCEYSIIVSEMPWMAANPSKSSSSFGYCPTPCGVGTSFNPVGVTFLEVEPGI